MLVGWVSYMLFFCIFCFNEACPKDPWDWYIPLHLVNLYGFHVGKYTVPPMGILWDGFLFE